jgi:hypothetical protein
VILQQAMQALDEKHLLEGSVTPLAVKWADPELQIKKRRAVEDSNADNRMVSRLMSLLIIFWLMSPYQFAGYIPVVGTF